MMLPRSGERRRLPDKAAVLGRMFLCRMHERANESEHDFGKGFRRVIVK